MNSVQNIREGDRPTGSSGNTISTSTAPHPLPISFASSSISDCPFASLPRTQEEGPSTAVGAIVSERPFSYKDPLLQPVTGQTFSASSTPPASPLPVYPASKTLVASPYTEKSHHLNLATIPWNYQLLALALTQLSNAIPTFPTSSYDISFNWSKVVSTTRALHEQLESPLSEHGGANAKSSRFPQTTAYVIVFRSRRAVPILTEISNHLTELDLVAHEEAAISGGLLKYWYGAPDAITGRNLATCLWVDHEHAVRGGGGPGHIKAMRQAKSSYVGWEVERLRLIIEEGAEEYRFERW